MVAALGDLEIGGIRRGREHAGGEFGVKVRVKRMVRGAPVRWGFTSLEDVFELARADHKVNFGDLSQNVLAEAFHEASGDHELLRRAQLLVFRHLQDGVNRLALGRLDEAARVDNDDVGVSGARRQLVAPAGQDAEHHFAVHQVLGTAQTHHSHFRHC